MSTRRKIQLLLWAYFWLIIFEGAIRKWLLPGLSTPLLVIRDPIALGAFFLGLPYLMNGPHRVWFWWMCWIGGLGFFLALLVGHRDPPTALFGARIWLVHLPLIFLFGQVFNRDDVWSFIRWTALVAIPMAVLIVMQYSLPQSHILNVAPGGEEGGGFSGALGRFRPPGTFSFTSGLAEFFGLAAAGVAAWMLGGPRPVPKWLWLSAAAVIAALPVSISRGLLFKYALTGVAVAIATIIGKRQITGLLYGGVVIMVAGIAVSQIPVLQEARTVFEHRWKTATETEGGESGVRGVLAERVAGYTLGALPQALEFPLLGYGIGLGTHFGAVRVTGTRKYAIAEGVWGATLGELGPFLGIIALGLRMTMAVWLSVLAWRQARRGNTLPLMLASCALPLVSMGQTSQPTALGFIVLGGGLMLAACNPTLAELKRRQATRQAAATASQSLAGPGVAPAFRRTLPSA